MPLPRHAPPRLERRVLELNATPTAVAEKRHRQEEQPAAEEKPMRRTCPPTGESVAHDTD